jgi:hypothetical protein
MWSDSVVMPPPCFDQDLGFGKTFEWRVIEPLLPNKPQCVPRVDYLRIIAAQRGPVSGQFDTATWTLFHIKM